MAALAAGEEDALEELVARHRGRVLGVAVRALGDRARAEEIAQETFLRVYRAAPTYEPRGRFAPWLLTIASRLCLNAAREKRRRREVPLDTASTAAASAAPEAVLSRELKDALARLPPRHRLALTLKVVEGLSYREIALVLQCSEQDVANGIFRARKALRRSLGPP